MVLCYVKLHWSILHFEWIFDLCVILKHHAFVKPWFADLGDLLNVDLFNYATSKKKKSHPLISSPVSFIPQTRKSLSAGCKDRGKTLWGQSEKAAVPKPGSSYRNPNLLAP